MNAGTICRVNALACLRFATVLAAGLAGLVTAAPPAFDRDIRPILRASCTHCHGEEEELAGGVDLRLHRFMLRAGESGGPVIVPGDPDASLLIEVIESGEMPQEGRPVPAEQLALLRRWIAAGAPGGGPEPESLPPGPYFATAETEHWAFLPITRPAVPATANPRVRNEVDAFISQKLAEQGVGFAPDADRRTLIRRLSFDLTGLPPTPEETDSFLADTSADAYERLVDRLLASPAYGERWARHWLDVAGYADSAGHAEADSLRPYAWHYRDYVINAFNTDKPWDQFLTEQLAGDELAGVVHGDTAEAILDPARREQLTATGFLRMAPDGTGDKVADVKLARNEAVAEQLKVVSSALLGLTVGCAQCHDHRFDPVSQADYYRFRAIFEPAFDWQQWRSPTARNCSLATPADKAKAAEIEQQAKAIEAEAKVLERKFLDEIFEKEILKLPEDVRDAYREARATPKNKQSPAQQALIKKYPSALALYSLNLYDKKADKQVKDLRAKATALRKTKPPEDFVMATTEVRGRVPAMQVFYRGDHEQPRQEVPPGELAVLATSAVEPLRPAEPTGGSSGRRLAYARWLTSGEHPLVARVLVNRFWMHHFGRGIVSTPGDFGLAGQRPSHPELLDWLADRFMASGWRLKPLHRLLVTSTAYRQASRHPEAVAIDPEGRLFARWLIRRLDAEQVRDATLLAAGRLNGQVGGPPVSIGKDPYGRIIAGKEELNANGDVVKVLPVGEEACRRSIYLTARRTTPVTTLQTFDAPTMLPNCEQRTSSTVAPQSLFMLNDAFVHEQATAIAKEVQKQAPGDLRRQIHRAWTMLTAHEPETAELGRALAYLAEQTESLRAFHAATADATAGKAAKPAAPAADPEAEAFASLCQVLLSSTRFLYID